MLVKYLQKSMDFPDFNNQFHRKNCAHFFLPWINLKHGNKSQNNGVTIMSDTTKKIKHIIYN